MFHFDAGVSQVVLLLWLSLLLLVAAVGLCCWLLLLLVVAVGRCCWLLMLVVNVSCCC
jgi:hypothetical protein